MRTEFELILNFQTHREVVLSLRKRSTITGWKYYICWTKGGDRTEFTLQTLSSVMHVFRGVDYWWPRLRHHYKKTNSIMKSRKVESFPCYVWLRSIYYMYVRLYTFLRFAMSACKLALYMYGMIDCDRHNLPHKFIIYYLFE